MGSVTHQPLCQEGPYPQGVSILEDEHKRDDQVNQNIILQVEGDVVMGDVEPVIRGPSDEVTLEG